MTKSMTGFARKTLQIEHGEIIIELKSLNSRYLDLHFKLPDEAKFLEPQIRQKISTALLRGKVECTINIQKPKQQEHIFINEPKLEELLTISKEISNKHGLESVRISELLTIKGILIDDCSTDVDYESLIMPLIGSALLELVKQREIEGNQLNLVLSDKIASVIDQITQIKENYQNMQHVFKEKLKAKFTDLNEQFNLETDNYRFEQELIYFFNKMDIEEEIDRLNSHIQQLKNILEQDNNAKGRKLDFLLQEMNREANTLGSKSQNYDLIMNTVELKVLFEQIREQVQNIE